MNNKIEREQLMPEERAWSTIDNIQSYLSTIEHTQKLTIDLMRAGISTRDLVNVFIYQAVAIVVADKESHMAASNMLLEFAEQEREKAFDGQ